jgi:hypothetical protein
MALTYATLVDLNANELILDLDADTTITADSDDTIDFKIGGSDEIKMTTAALSPATSDGNALGTAALEWSDLFLADGALIYFGDDQDTTLTHADGSGLTLNSTNKLMFNDASQFIQGSSATVLSIGATDEIDLTATAIDINGTCDISGTFSLAGTAITTTAAEINLIDGGTARGTDAVATGDGILINDAGTMKMTNVDTVSTYFSSHNVGGSNIVTTGALDSGSITSGFGTIDTGSSAITSTGVITGGTVEVTTDTAAGDNAAMGYTATEGLILTGQGSTSDVVIKNDADATVFSIATGTTTGTFAGTVLAKTDTDATNTGSVTLDFTANQNFVLTLTGNVTLANPTTEQVGQSGFIAFIQDGTGSRTVSLGTDYETAAAAGLTLTSTASATDLVPYLVVASGRILLGTPQLAFA